MHDMSERLARKIERDFAEPGAAQEVTRIVSGAADSERVQAAIVLAARRDLPEVARQADLAQVDWRDVLVNGGLENEDWPAILDRVLS